MKKILMGVLVFLLCGVMYSFGVATYENIKIDSMLEEFISKGEYIKEEAGILYYEVPNDNAVNEYSAFSDSNERELGQPGDMIVAYGSHFPDIAPLHWWIDTNFGFHAALVMGKNEKGQNTIGEAVITSVKEPNDILFNMLWPRDKDYPENIFGGTGVKRKTDNYFLKKRNWYGDYYGGYFSDSIVGLRIKNITDSDRINVVSAAQEIIDSDQIYNYLFFINNDSGMKVKAYYCTSFIEKAFSVVNPENREEPYDINYDDFAIPINDMVLSEDTYIYSYFRVTDEGIAELYYLEGNKTWEG